ncbi:MAG: NAD(P)/FAD-dependent oxidoreductase [Eubacteriales bacterium]|nr:NAD(P)/FAD-dependent oxidoreductase [Eubacteriales bacterium]
MKRIIVIGAGASGMLAAISAARCGASVTLLEGKEKPGKKLLITGSGRCNLTNLVVDVKRTYHGAGEKFITNILNQFSVQDTLSFFEEIGLKVCDREGYIYPVAGQAQSVLNVLLLELRRLSVKIKYSEKVISIERDKGNWKVSTKGWTYEADAVILAAGSKAAPATGSDGSGYLLAESVGHRLVKPLPALAAMTAKENWLKKIAGVRMPAKIILKTNENEFAESGELQWTDYGISGIAVFQLSGFAARELDSGRKVSVILDLLPFDSEENLYMWAVSRCKDLKYEDVFAGWLPAKSITPLLRGAGYLPDEKVCEKVLQKIIYDLKHFTLDIAGVKGFENAQVCSGGVDTSEINEQTLESRIVSGLFIAGELLDVDGICGGYNLQWAWSSGWTAGIHSSGGERTV